MLLTTLILNKLILKSKSFLKNSFKNLQNCIFCRENNDKHDIFCFFLTQKIHRFQNKRFFEKTLLETQPQSKS